jgi:hypothetical protein
MQVTRIALQGVVAEVLGAIYDADLLGFNNGSRLAKVSIPRCLPRIRH